MEQEVEQKRDRPFRRLSSLPPIFVAGLWRVPPRKWLSTALFCQAAVVVATLFFCRLHNLSYGLFFFALFAGLLLGMSVALFEVALDIFQVWLLAEWGKLFVGFVSFFSHIIGYLILSSILVSLPLGWLIEQVGLSGEQATDYGLFLANFIILLALVNWLRDLRVIWHNSSSHY
ncbi:MAG: hypothetical protein A2521_01465 [Deltaproteobacteria bacterium RIFOXYD12_FULL_57_12]|nr:MAG: hypothetical protein A2521_01465 [Deltaproteobacteria bacterium RIFOXYD12_FULL_57_12]